MTAWKIDRHDEVDVVHAAWCPELTPAAQPYMAVYPNPDISTPGLLGVETTAQMREHLQRPDRKDSHDAPTAVAECLVCIVAVLDAQ